MIIQLHGDLLEASVRLQVLTEDGAFLRSLNRKSKLFNYNTKGKQDRSSLLSMTVKVMPARLIKWDR